MSILSSRVQALLQRNVALFLKDRCFIERAIVTPDEYGGEGTTTWQQIAASVPCRLITPGAMSGSQVQDIGTQESILDRYRMILPVDQYITPDCRILHQNIYYSVVAIQSQLTDELYTSVTLQRSIGASHV